MRNKGQLWNSAFLYYVESCPDTWLWPATICYFKNLLASSILVGAQDKSELVNSIPVACHGGQVKPHLG